MKTVARRFLRLGWLFLASTPVLLIKAVWTTGDSGWRLGVTGLITFLVGLFLLITGIEMDADL